MDYADNPSLLNTKVVSGEAGRLKPLLQQRPARVAFDSILYEDGVNGVRNAPRDVPAYFRDLNLDQIVDAITAGKQEYDLKPFFYEPLKTIEAIAYRHEVMRDMEVERIRDSIKQFSDTMRLMRQTIVQADKLYHKYQKERWFLRAVESYCTIVLRLQSDLAQLDLSSRGLLSFRDYVADYAGSDHFGQLLGTVNKLTRNLGNVQYSILVKDNGFRVRNYDSESDYSAEVTDVFKKFQQGDANNYLVKFQDYLGMNSIEGTVLDFVALLNQELFSSLDEFCGQHANYADPVLVKFDREIQFYMSYIEYISRLKRAGLAFCYPLVSIDEKDVNDEAGFDLALATKLIGEKKSIVCNDFRLSGKERIFVVSGPNQGGKTTFARTFGQLHHLASLGCQVPGKTAKVFLFDAIFTHFEREEAINSLDGKLQDDLIRFHEILRVATPRSIVIINEIFGATALQDAVFLARKVIDRIMELDSLCVCVTFLDELASLSDHTVSMVSTVLPENPASRTFKVMRRPADGRAYAISIAEKYRLTYDCLTSRMCF